MPSGATVVAGIPFRAQAAKHGLAEGEYEEVQAVQVEVDAVEEGVEILGGDTFWKGPHVQLGVDRPGHLDHHVQLWPAHAGERRATLPVEVHEAEVVELSQMEGSDASAP